MHTTAASWVGVQIDAEVALVRIIASVLVLRPSLICHRSCRGVVSVTHVGVRMDSDVYSNVIFLIIFLRLWTNKI